MKLNDSIDSAETWIPHQFALQVVHFGPESGNYKHKKQWKVISTSERLAQQAFAGWNTQHLVMNLIQNAIPQQYKWMGLRSSRSSTQVSCYFKIWQVMLQEILSMEKGSLSNQLWLLCVRAPASRSSCI